MRVPWLLLFSTASAVLFAQDYPAKSVRMIEPFGAGGGVDTIAHTVSPKLSELWGQPVTVENHPGAGSTEAPALVARSPADGYTLLVSSSAQAYSAAFVRNLAYDPLKDFITVAPLTSQPYVLVASKSSGISSLGELIAIAKEKPGQLRFGSAGVGAGNYVGIEKFNLEAGIKAVHVPPGLDDSIADVITNTVAGRTDYLIAPIPLAPTHIRTGRLLPLGVTTKKRSPLLPEVPTISQAGVADFDYAIWYGVWAPAGTPSVVVDRIAKDIARVMSAPELLNSLAKHGADPMSMSQAEFVHFVQSESQSAASIREAGGVKSE